MLKVNWATVYQVDKENFLKPYESAFSEGVGTLKGMKAKFYTDETVNHFSTTGAIPAHRAMTFPYDRPVQRK